VVTLALIAVLGAYAVASTACWCAALLRAERAERMLRRERELLHAFGDTITGLCSCPAREDRPL
jgi:hypothetical protein